MFFPLIEESFFSTIEKKLRGIVSTYSRGIDFLIALKCPEGRLLEWSQLAYLVCSQEIYATRYTR